MVLAKPLSPVVTVPSHSVMTHQHFNHWLPCWWRVARWGGEGWMCSLVALRRPDICSCLYPMGKLGRVAWTLDMTNVIKHKQEKCLKFWMIEKRRSSWPFMRGRNVFCQIGAGVKLVLFFWQESASRVLHQKALPRCESVLLLRRRYLESISPLTTIRLAAWKEATVTTPAPSERFGDFHLETFRAAAQHKAKCSEKWPLVQMQHSKKTLYILEHCWAH